MPSQDQIAAHRLSEIALNADASGQDVVRALNVYLLAKIAEYRESMANSLERIEDTVREGNTDDIKAQVADYEGAQHCALELEDLLGLTSRRVSVEEYLATTVTIGPSL